ncbi:type II toxin-antitoxin system HicA family toxin [Desulfovermiculus halophilus]|uniref:type II toxin-antitoxin system HicA family toxin n=1 Tax=Desulfovermiculus halophilus TaxID=339722 RepID=UPI000A007093|nr:type II toxin-antitoxin system HicA family toxin [Desulfovermiculus halophilus]
MGTIPVLKPREVVHILEKLGFEEVRQRGAHKQFRHPDGKCTTVPFHPGKDISPVLLGQIAKDINIQVEDLLRYR